MQDKTGAGLVITGSPRQTIRVPHKEITIRQSSDVLAIEHPGLAAGNGIVAGTPFENIRAFLDEAMVNGEANRRSR